MTASIAIGVPVASSLTAAAVVKTNQTTLEMLVNLQKMMDEFKSKIVEMEDEMNAIKIENSLLKNKISELTTRSSSSSSSLSTAATRKGLFGYGPDEF